MSAELDQLRARYEQFQATMKRVESPMLDVNQMKAELVALESSATSPRGGVTVIAGPGGSIKDIRISDEAGRQPGAMLAAEIMSTLRQAVAGAARSQAAIVDQHSGSRLHTMDRVLQDQADALGTTVEELKSTLPPGDPAAPRTRPQARRNDDDFSENTLMSKGHRRPPEAPSEPPPPPPPSSGGSSAGDKFLKNLFAEDEDQ